MPERPHPTAANLWLFGLLTIGLFAVLGVIDGRLHDTGGPGIVPFEVSFTADRARETLADWGPGGRDDAQLSLWLDYGFLAAYGVFFTLAVRKVRALLGWRRLAFVAVFPLAAAACDAVENANLLMTIGQGGDQPWPLLAGLFASAKFALLTPAQIYALAGFAVWLVRRRRV